MFGRVDKSRVDAQNKITDKRRKTHKKPTTITNKQSNASLNLFIIKLLAPSVETEVKPAYV